MKIVFLTDLNLYYYMKKGKQNVRFCFFMANYQTCSSKWGKMLPLVSVIQWAENIYSEVSDQLVSLAAEWLQEEKSDPSKLLWLSPQGLLSGAAESGQAVLLHGRPVPEGTERLCCGLHGKHFRGFLITCLKSRTQCWKPHFLNKLIMFCVL